MKPSTANTPGFRINQLAALIARRRRLQLLLAMLVGFLLAVITMILFNAATNAGTEQTGRSPAVSGHHWFQDHDDD